MHALLRWSHLYWFSPVCITAQIKYHHYINAMSSTNRWDYRTTSLCQPSNICNICRYSISGYVEELPRLPENRAYHACAALPSTGVSPTDILKPVQAFIVVGGWRDHVLSSVVTLFPGATAWTSLASLPRALRYAQASIVGGRIRVNGGLDVASGRSEVMVDEC